MSYYEDLFNTVHKVVYDGDTVSFIINTAGEPDFWTWSVDWHDVADYFQNKGIKSAIVELVSEKLSRVNCNQFVNDIENDTLGSSCGSFASVDDALKDLGIL